MAASSQELSVVVSKIRTACCCWRSGLISHTDGGKIRGGKPDSALCGQSQSQSDLCPQVGN